MKCAIAILAMLAATCAATTVRMYDSSYHGDLEIPVTGYWSGKFIISAAEAEKAAYLEINTDFNTYDTSYTKLDVRIVEVFASLSETQPATRPAATFQFKQSTKKVYELPVDELTNCTGGCTIYLHFWANCTDYACINDITTSIWVREKFSTGLTDYVYTTSTLPHVVLYENVPSCPFTVTKSAYSYFTFVPKNTTLLPMTIDTNFLSSMDALASWSDVSQFPNKNNITAGGVQWFQTEATESHPFDVAHAYTIAVFGHNTISTAPEFQLCIGNDCGAASSVVATAFALVLSALASLL